MFNETSQGAEAFNPWFIIPCGEERSKLIEIFAMFEQELDEALEDLIVEYNGQKFEIKIKIGLMFDTKLIRYATGLFGSFCTMCTCSENEACDPKFIEKGFKLDRSPENLSETFRNLVDMGVLVKDEEKPLSYKLAKRSKNYHRYGRNGMTQPNLLTKYDATKMPPILHMWICLIGKNPA